MEWQQHGEDKRAGTEGPKAVTVADAALSLLRSTCLRPRCAPCLLGAWLLLLCCAPFVSCLCMCATRCRVVSLWVRWAGLTARVPPPKRAHSTRLCCSSRRRTIEHQATAWGGGRAHGTAGTQLTRTQLCELNVSASAFQGAAPHCSLAGGRSSEEQRGQQHTATAPRARAQRPSTHEPGSRLPRAVLRPSKPTIRRHGESQRHLCGGRLAQALPCSRRCHVEARSQASGGSKDTPATPRRGLRPRSALTPQRATCSPACLPRGTHSG